MYMHINKLGSRSYSYIHPKSSHICVIHLILEKFYFEAILPKKKLGPLGVKLHFMHNICLSTIEINHKDNSIVTMVVPYLQLDLP